MAEPCTDLTELGERVFQQRRRLRMEQADVADRAGLSTAYVSRLERARIPNPKITDLRRIATALDLGLDQLVADGPPPPSDVDDALRTLSHYPELADDVMLMVRALAQASPEERDVTMTAIRALIRRLAARHQIALD